MARIKLEMPEAFVFQTNIAIRITDVNYGNHVGNDAFLSLMHEARVQFLAARGYTELDIEGLGIIMTDAAIVYKSQLYYGDVVQIQIGLMDISAIGFDLCYQLQVEKEGVKKIAALAKTGVVLFDYGRQKMAHLTQEIIDKLKG